MDVMWAGGESNVRDVAEKLGRPLAYTTVMTTLDRLFKKGLARRSGHSFIRRDCRAGIGNGSALVNWWRDFWQGRNTRARC
jgi:hypothetical protein